MRFILITIVAMTAFFSCALDKLATGALADALTGPGGSTVFTGDDDPELVGDALPFAIKLYETIMAAQPTHVKLKETIGSLYVMYANAFIASPSFYFTETEFDKKDMAIFRSKKLYIRAGDILSDGLEIQRPGFKIAFQNGDLSKWIATTKKEDTGMLYWFGASWLAALSSDALDAKFGVKLPLIKIILEKALELDADYGKGSLHDLMTIFYASMPEGLGKDLVKAEQEHNKALVVGGPTQAGPLMTWAEIKFLGEQKRPEFEAMMQKILAIDPKSDKESTLLNVLVQRKAQFYLKHLDEFFW